MYIKKNRFLFPIICLILFPAIIYAQYYDITTVAGNGDYGFSNDGGFADAATLNYPINAVVDISGNLFISDWGNSRIRKVNTNSIISTIAGDGKYGYSGDGGSSLGSILSGPTGIFVDNKDNLYIADIGNGRIREISNTGIITTIAGNGNYGYTGDGGMATNASFKDPTGITMDASGNMFIADVFNNVIRKINTSGIISTIAGNGIAGYWGDGGMATMAELYYPTSIAADDSGNIFIADEDNNRIRKVNSNGIITTVAGNGKGAYSGDGGLATAASINFPGAVTIDRMNNIYIADSYNGRIRMVNNKGIITTIAGNGKTGYSGDNDLATLAEFNNPVGISIDTAGNLYIGDSFNYRVRKLTKFERELGNSNGSVNIFPNPNHGVFNINTESLKVTSQIEIFNILGQQIFYTNINPNSQTEIDLSHESPGIYIYQVIVTGNVIISRGRIVIL